MDPLSAIGAIGGSVVSGLFSRSEGSRQAKLQKQFAKSGIQWKVADAKKAGVHPLYALGAQTTPYSPVSVGTPDFTSAGQQLGRAVYQHMNPQERQSADLALENAKLQNDYLRAQIANVQATTLRSVSPPISQDPRTLLTGQGNTEVKRPTRLTHTSMTTPIGTILANPDVTDVDQIEQRYGEIPFPFNYYHYLSTLGGDLAYTQAVRRAIERPRYMRSRQVGSPTPTGRNREFQRRYVSPHLWR